MRCTLFLVFHLHHPINIYSHKKATLLKWLDHSNYHLIFANKPWNPPVKLWHAVLCSSPKE